MVVIRSVRSFQEGELIRLFQILLLGTLLVSGIVRDAAASRAVLLEITGPIGPATSDYVIRGLEAVSRDESTLMTLAKTNLCGPITVELGNVAGAARFIACLEGGGIK